MKIKSILSKSIAIAALAFAGAVAVKGSAAQAAIVKNDVTTYHVSVATRVYNDYKKDKKATGQVLRADSNWKVIRTAYDHNGHKWYDLGKDQWVKVVKSPAASQSISQAPVQKKQVNTAASQSTQTSQTNQTSSNYSSTASGSEAAAKAWIAGRESGGSYGARNGNYVGKYQLSASYLHGDYSAANQERAADSYVKSRYGSWTAAKSFWQANGYY